MQLDMHYYGTYALALAAGLTPEAAQIVATSAEFVDDNTARDHVEFQNGPHIDKEATAHHTVDSPTLTYTASAGSGCRPTSYPEKSETRTRSG